MQFICQVNVNPKEYWEIVGELGDGAFGKVEKAVSKSDKNLYAAAKMMLEFCGGGAVDAIMIELEKPLTEKQIAYIARYTCEAMAFLHESNVIHRDLKAGNILLTIDGVVKLADFGVSAKLKDRNEKRDTFIGTPYWMAPEVMMCETFKDQPYDTRSDIWSYGITLIEMAQMEPPHSNVSPMRVLIKVQKSAPPTLDNPSSWSIFFVDFLSHCLVKDPSERRTAKQLLSHPFIASATDRHPVLALLAEVNAEIQEEVVIDDDRASCDENNTRSIVVSEDSVWAAVAPIPQSKDGTQQLADPVLKKRAAPPPPTDGPKVSSPTIVETKHPDKELYIQPSPQQLKAAGDLVSPGREALNILDDLNVTLDKQNSSSISILNDDAHSQESFKPAPDLEHTTEITVHSPTPQHKIKDVVGAVRAATKSPSPQLHKDRQKSPATSSENVYFRNSLSKSASQQSVQDKAVIKVGIDVPYIPLSSVVDSAHGSEKPGQITEKEMLKTSLSASQDKSGDAGVGIRKHPHRQTVTKKTRTYTIDGMQVTSTTMHVLGAKEDMQMRFQIFLPASFFCLRKQQLQDLRRLQREEARQKQKLQLEGANLVEQQERKFQQEKAVSTRQYEIDMEAMERKQKREIEEAEKLQEEEMRQAQKRLKYEQEKELRGFKDRLKQEMKIMKQEMDMLPRQQRRDALRMKKDQMEHENHMKEADFVMQLQKNAEATLARMTQRHKEEEDELVRALALDRKKLPKMLRNEAKTRSVMFKESLRISMQSMTPAEMAEKLRRFDEHENMRIRNALEEHDLKSAKKIAQLKEKHQQAMNELDEMQNEKRKQLLEKERNTMQEHEKQYFSMREQWQADLAPRKLLLERRFQEEMEAQERFYGIPLSGTIASTPVLQARVH
ncbi:unnamed protein product [Strongylus vulgaris]|uniref:Protein kinase domain-containing protein n=1 Tax=Strongylus vulgaris TaxID=40348 RepID=A0A3P7J7B5_STRVU|nr:unnamed protein product [Strongylus vulgaris]